MMLLLLCHRHRRLSARPRYGADKGAPLRSAGVSLLRAAGQPSSCCTYLRPHAKPNIFAEWRRARPPAATRRTNNQMLCVCAPDKFIALRDSLDKSSRSRERARRVGELDGVGGAGHGQRRRPCSLERLLSGAPRRMHLHS
jgi:hypothetical protein